MHIKTTRILSAALLLALPACNNGGTAESEDSTGTAGTADTADSEATPTGGGTDADTGGDDGPCPSDADFFAQSIQAPILGKTCIACHTEQGAAKATRMVLLPADAAGALEHNLAELREVALVDEDGTSLLLLKPTGKHTGGHTGGVVVKEDSAEYRALEQFVARTLGPFTCDEDPSDGDAAGCDQGGAGVRRVRRLSHVEYNRTLADILGAPTELGLAFASDSVVQGFSNNADALLVNGLLADQYREAAETVAEQIVADLPARLGCDPVADGEDKCAADFITRFGKQAFRRPLSATEVGRYKTLWAEAAEAEGFEAGIRWVITALLQSPGFLYRTELGEHAGDGVYKLTPHELASELSYLILGGPPDAELIAAADDGSLTDAETLRAQADRLLALAESEKTFHRFVDEWLHLDRLRVAARDAMLYPELTPQIRDAMIGETHRLVSDVYRSGGTLADLLTAKYSFMTDALAQYYKLPAGAGEADADGFKRVEGTGNAAGLLAQGGLLTTHALPTSSSPIHRGKLVRERLLCQEMPPPPPALDTSPPPVDPTLSTRERYTQHASDATCAGCHARIDPIGFGFEHYDAVGRYRMMDGEHVVDASGEIVLTDQTNGTFDGLDELAQLLAGSPEVEACYTLQWARHALGSAEESELTCVQDEVTKAFTEAEGRLDSLVRALIETRFFRERGGAAVDDPGEEPGDDTGAQTTGPDTTGGDDDTTGGGDDTTGGGGPGPMTTAGIDATVVQDSKWDAGECNTVTVTNTTDAPIVWTVGLPLQGTIQNIWNGKATAVDGGLQFVGEPYNAEVAPKTSTSFGFCLNY